MSLSVQTNICERVMRDNVHSNEDMGNVSLSDITILNPATYIAIEGVLQTPGAFSAFEAYEPAFGYVPVLKVPEMNFEASEFIEENMNEIRNSILKMGIHPDKVNDLLNDVYVSIRQDELDGHGYDYELCGIDVRQFVFGRIKGYSLNKRYDIRYVESRNGCDLVAASADESDSEDKLSGFQAAYKNASSYDDIDNIEVELSVRDAIETCMDLCYGTTICIASLFREVESIDSLISRYSRSKGVKSVFVELQNINKDHPEFMEAMTLALKFRSGHKDQFIGILDKVEKDFELM